MVPPVIWCLARVWSHPCGESWNFKLTKIGQKTGQLRSYIAICVCFIFLLQCNEQTGKGLSELHPCRSWWWFLPPLQMLILPQHLPFHPVLHPQKGPSLEQQAPVASHAFRHLQSESVLSCLGTVMPLLATRQLPLPRPHTLRRGGSCAMFPLQPQTEPRLDDLCQVEQVNKT